MAPRQDSLSASRAGSNAVGGGRRYRFFLLRRNLGCRVGAAGAHPMLRRVPKGATVERPQSLARHLLSACCRSNPPHWTGSDTNDRVAAGAIRRTAYSTGLGG